MKQLTVQIFPFVETRIGYTFLYITYKLPLPIISYTSYHPHEQHYAVIRYMFNSLSVCYPYTSKEHEVWIIIQKIVHNNSLYINSIKECYRKLSKKNAVYNIGWNRGQKWYTIMYVGKEMTFLAKIFELTDLKLAFKPNKSLEHNLRTHTMEIDISQVVCTS